MSFTNITAVGRLVRDPSLKTLDSGMHICKFGIAINKRRKGEDVAHFFDCVAWSKTAEFIDQYFAKGGIIAVVGDLEQERWETQDGKRSKIIINVRAAMFAGDSGKPKQAETTRDGGETFENIDF